MPTSPATGPGLVIAGFIVGMLAVGVSAWFWPAGLLLFAIGIMAHASTQTQMVAEDFADLRKRLAAGQSTSPRE